jgi:hypothetical protein
MYICVYICVYIYLYTYRHHHYHHHHHYHYYHHHHRHFHRHHYHHHHHRYLHHHHYHHHHHYSYSTAFFYDSLHAGCIPIVISDWFVFAFPSVIDYKEFVIRYIHTCSDALFFSYGSSQPPYPLICISLCIPLSPTFSDLRYLH